MVEPESVAKTTMTSSNACRPIKTTQNIYHSNVQANPNVMDRPDKAATQAYAPALPTVIEEAAPGEDCEAAALPVELAAGLEELLGGVELAEPGAVGEDDALVGATLSVVSPPGMDISAELAGEQVES